MAENAPSSSSSRRDLLDNVWRAVGGEHATIAILLAIVAGLVVASLLPQPSRIIASEPELLDRWITTTASRYGQAGATLAVLGLFSIGSSWWFTLISAFAVLHLLVRIADSLRLAVRSLLPSAASPEGPLYADGSQANINLTMTGESTRQRVRLALADNGLIVKGSNETPDLADRDHFYAHRAPIGTLAPAIIAVGVLLIVFAAWSDRSWGWHSQSLELVRGQRLVLERDLDWSAYLDSAATEAEMGRLAITMAGRTEHLGFAPGHPTRYRGVTLNQVSSGPVLWISAIDPGGSPLTVQSGQREEANGLALIFNRARTERQATIPGANLALRVVLQTAGPDVEMSAPSFAVAIYRGGLLDPVYSATIAAGTELSWEGTTVQLDVDRYATILASRQPGAPLRWAGAILLLLGLVIPLLCPGLQVWARLTPERRATRVEVWATVQAAGYDPQDALNLIISSLGGDHDREA